jgi:hypothetical protein
MELNRDQIIKGLECCTTIDACKRCPCYNKPTCGLLLRKNALSLIYELAEENKRLKEKADRFLDNLKAVLDERAKSQTNFDRITESVESLAEFIVEETSDLRGSEIIYYAYGESCPTYEKEEAIKSTIEWLNREAEDEEI